MSKHVVLPHIDRGLCKARGWENALTKAWEKIFTQYIDRKPWVIGEEFEELKNICDNWKEKIENKGLYALITLNFPDSWDYDNCVTIEESVMPKLISKKWMKDWVYNWEFTDKDGEWSHPHIHLFCAKGNKPKSTMITEIWNTLSTFSACSDLSKNSIHIKLFNGSNYMNGLEYIKKNRPADVEQRVEWGFGSNVMKGVELDSRAIGK